jgi:hypothetical protein
MLMSPQPQSQWTTAGFMQKYEEYCALPEVLSYFEAYRRTEADHKRLFGHERYSSYDSFRMTRKQMLSKK